MVRTCIKSPIRDEEVCIVFISDWMGNIAGSEKKVWAHVADDLIERGIAKVNDKIPQDYAMDEKIERKKKFSRMSA
jgi:hypothetical protein